MFDSHKIDDYFDGKRPFENAKPDDKPKTSVWLRFVKLGFPCLAAAILGVMVVMPNIKKSVDLQDDITVPRKNEMEKLHIEQTVYYATDAANRVSKIIADSVDELAPGSKEVKINNPKAEIASAKGIINILSKTGFFNQDAGILKLREQVMATDENKNKITTEEADYDFNKNYGYGSSRINAEGTWGDLEAQGFEFFKLDNILVLKGKHIVTTSQGTLTAEKETRYFENAHKSVSLGNVIIRQGDNILYADKVIAFYNTSNELQKAEAYGNVRIVTPKGKAYGDKGVYNPKTSKVELLGKVKIEQQGNVINGSKAETDLQTQISTISGNKKTGGRITGTFYSKRKSENGKKSDK